MRSIVWSVGLVGLLLCAQNQRIENLAPYTPTPDVVVDKMLELAALKPGERLFDLGSGDGRIVIHAARKYAAKATGVEFDEALYRQSTQLIRSLGLAGMAQIILGDLMRQDYSDADVITVYLLPVASLRLAPMLEKQLRPGARVVSHNSTFPGWKVRQVLDIPDGGDGKTHVVYLYVR